MRQTGFNREKMAPGYQEEWDGGCDEVLSGPLVFDGWWSTRGPPQLRYHTTPHRNSKAFFGGAYENPLVSLNKALLTPLFLVGGRLTSYDCFDGWVDKSNRTALVAEGRC